MKNREGTLSRGAQEWGRKHRKEEAQLRGLNGRGARQMIEEQLAELVDDLLAAEEEEDLTEWSTEPGDRYVSWIDDLTEVQAEMLREYLTGVFERAEADLTPYVPSGIGMNVEESIDPNWTDRIPGNW